MNIQNEREMMIAIEAVADYRFRESIKNNFSKWRNFKPRISGWFFIVQSVFLFSASIQKGVLFSTLAFLFYLVGLGLCMYGEISFIRDNSAFK